MKFTKLWQEEKVQILQANLNLLLIKRLKQIYYCKIE